MIDWRSQLCQFLRMAPESSDASLLENLQDASDKLEVAKKLTSMVPESHDTPLQFQMIHRVDCALERGTTLYLGEPYVVNSGPRNAHIRASQSIDNFELYLERNKTLSFIAYKNYLCCNTDTYHLNQQPIIDASALITGESVAVISPEFCSGLTLLTQQSLSEIPHPIFEVNEEFSSPYLWWYHRRQRIADQEEFLNDCQTEHIALFQKYLSDCLGAQWEQVDSLLSRGMISAEFIEYLYVSKMLYSLQFFRLSALSLHTQRMFNLFGYY